MALYAIGDLHLCLGAPKPMDIFGGNCGDIIGGKPAAKKIIINGQILIIRDGKIYNAQGVQVQ